MQNPEDDMLHHLHMVTIEALSIARKLADWIEENCESTFPIPNVRISRDLVDLRVAEFSLWDSESSDIDELTFEACLAEYHSQVIALLEPFVQKLPAEN